MKKITKIEAKKTSIPKKKRVAAYCRISMQTERMNHSLSSQISYYSHMIQSNPEWEYAGVYSDNGISGTTIKKRAGFQQMIEDCNDGKIDIILTKSIQRFARNTVDLLETVRDLKSKGIEVRFEKENIYSLSGDGELMLSILASFAQEESRSLSENAKWSIRKRWEAGKPNGHFNVYGYRWVGDDLVIVPEEAVIIRRMYDMYLNGCSRMDIEKAFRAEGIRTRGGYEWKDYNLKVILTNSIYKGQLVFQKEYCPDPIEKKRRKNYGELPFYVIDDHHEAIIEPEVFDAVQERLKAIREAGCFGNKSLNITCFTQKLRCARCGKNYVRNTRSNRNKYEERKISYWVCASTKKKKYQSCGACMLHETYLKKALAEVMGTEDFDEDLFKEQIDFIVVNDNKKLEVNFYDGRIVNTQVVSTAKKDWWTQERRKAWGEYQHSTWTPEKRKERGEQFMQYRMQDGFEEKRLAALKEYNDSRDPNEAREIFKKRRSDPEFERKRIEGVRNASKRRKGEMNASTEENS